MFARAQTSPLVQRALAQWFTTHQRDLPWRRTRDPFRILVSEIMLQQTQVQRVIPKYREFLRRFPTVRALAKATPRDVLLVWAGMGYNRRALYLLRAARGVVRTFGGRVPTEPSLLVELPGVGPYTAAAVATFSTGTPHALADTNVRRVIGRIFGGALLPKTLRSERGMLALVERTMPRRSVAGMRPSLWGHALMDFGALVCKAKPRCGVCPVRKWCKAYPFFQRASAQVGNRVPASVRRTRVGGKRARVVFSHAPTLARSRPRIVPDRIIRGRILTLVREADPAPTRISTLRPLLTGRSSRALSRLLRGLVSDGLLAFVGTRSVHLPRSLQSSNLQGGP